MKYTGLLLPILLMTAFLLGACGPSAEQIATMTVPAWTPTPPPPPITPSPTPIACDLNTDKEQLLKVLDGIQTLKWSGTGTSSTNGDFTVKGWDSPGRYHEIDVYKSGKVLEFIRVDNTYCSKETDTWSCYTIQIPTTLDILKNSVTATPAFLDYSIVNSTATIETYKDNQYLVFTQEAYNQSSNSSYVDKEYFDMNTCYPAYSILKWVYPDETLIFESQYTDFNEPVDEIILPVQ